MNSKTTERFWKCYEKLPLVTKKRANFLSKVFSEKGTCHAILKAAGIKK